MKTTLPVESLRSVVLRDLRVGPVVISSPTGSGKSTQVPRWCAEEGRVLVVEPRRVACRSLAVWVSKLERSPLGARVGYSVRDDHRVARDTQVVFATPGIVLKMLSEGSVDRFRTVVVDELHERRLDVDLICALLIERYEGRICAMSATIDGDRVAAQLGGVHHQAEGRTFPVDVRHLPGRTLLPEARGLEDRVCNAVRRAESDPGDVLVFLPGKAEIASVGEALRRTTSLEVLPLHGGLSLEEQSRVFTRGPRRRAILATNVAETSLTIDGVGVVIDSGLVRQTRYHAGRGFLTLVPIASDSAAQRAGRAGRTAAGVCYRLWDPAALLEAVTPPEVFRESLVPLVMAAAACDADATTLPFLDPPKPHSLEAARSELVALGALDEDGPGLTERGRRMFGLPLDSHLARLLVESEGTTCHEDIIDLVSVLGVGRPLFRSRPRGPDDGPDDPGEDDLRAAGCDATAVIRALRDGHPGRHGLASYPLREARATSRRLRKAFGLPPRAPADRRPDARAIAMLALRADPRAAHVKRVRKRGRKHDGAWSNGGTEIELGRGSAIDPEAVEAICVLDTRALGLGRRDTRIVVTHAIPLTRRDLLAAKLGRDRLAGVSVAAGRVIARIERVYARKVLATREETPTGSLARQAIRDLFLRGSVLKGALPRCEERLDAARLYLRLVTATMLQPAADWALDEYWGAQTTVPPTEDWVSARLEQLGVESGDDLELLSRADLIPPELPPLAQAALDRDYPRALTLGDARYGVSYDLRKRMVTLRQTGGDARGLPSLAYLPPLLGFGVTVESRGKTRVLRTRR